MEIAPMTLEGAHVRLAPLSMEYFEQLCEVGLDESLWRVTISLIRNREEMRLYILDATNLRSEGKAIPFVIVDKATMRAVGSTRYLNIDKAHKRLEIGSTWIAPKWQRTYVNTETKYLLLKHAFESLGCIRVEFKTDSINEQSRKALLGIGAKEEGILRNHMITPSDRIRHSVYFSIIDAEWQGVKKRLEERLKRLAASINKEG